MRTIVTVSQHIDLGGAMRRGSSMRGRRLRRARIDADRYRESAGRARSGTHRRVPRDDRHIPASATDASIRRRERARSRRASLLLLGTAAGRREDFTRCRTARDGPTNGQRRLAGEGATRPVQPMFKFESPRSGRVPRARERSAGSFGSAALGDKLPRWRATQAAVERRDVSDQAGLRGEIRAFVHMPRRSFREGRKEIVNILRRSSSGRFRRDEGRLSILQFRPT